jgi:hypothetical protein
MEKVTFTLVFILWATLGMLAQRDGGHYDYSHNNNTYQNQNTGSQNQYGSGTNSNRANGPGKGFRPYGNVGHRPSPNGTHHHQHNSNCSNSCNHNTRPQHNCNNNCNHNGGHHHNQHSCSGGQNCSFGCAHTSYVHVPVHVSAFSAWLHSLEHQRNSAARMGMALDYVENNWLTTHQIYDILGLFTNESTKFMIAENAYSNTCDPQNYHYLYPCFSNSACVMSLRGLGS